MRRGIGRWMRIGRFAEQIVQLRDALIALATHERTAVRAALAIEERIGFAFASRTVWRSRRLHRISIADGHRTRRMVHVRARRPFQPAMDVYQDRALTRRRRNRFNDHLARQSALADGC